MSKVVNALLSEGVSVDVKRGYSDTYVHFGRKAATMIAPDSPRPFSRKSTSTIEVSMVTDQSLSSPLKMNSDSAPISMTAPATAIMPAKKYVW